MNSNIRRLLPPFFIILILIFSAYAYENDNEEQKEKILLKLISQNLSSHHFLDVEINDDCYTFNLSSLCKPVEKPSTHHVKLKTSKPKSQRNNFIKDELILLYPRKDSSTINQITQKYNLKTTSRSMLSSVKSGLIIAKTNGQNPISLSAIINKREKGIEAKTNNMFSLASTSFKQAYSLDETGVRYVHKTTKGKNISICMVDTPVDIYHPSLSNALIETKDFIDLDPNNFEMMAHGTSVAGILVSQNKYIGVAPHAKLFAVSAFSTTKSKPFTLQGSSANIAKAIDSCIQHNVDVINLSFTGGKDDLIETLIKKAISKGVIVVAAGGNGGHWGSTIYPALIPGVLAATAVDNNKKLFSMADKGRFIDYAAPGVDILTLAPNGKYTLATGTSLSSAHLSGIVALLLSERHSKPINSTLKSTAVDLGKPGRDQEYGEGLVSASRALAVLKKQ